MSEALWGVIIGGFIGGTVGILTTILGNRAAAKRQREMLEHQSLESEKKYQREIDNQKIAAYKIILSELEIIRQSISRYETEPDKYKKAEFRVEFQDQIINFINVISPHRIHLDENFDKKLIEFTFELFKKDDKDGSKLYIFIGKFVEKMIPIARSKLDEMI